MVSLAEEFDWEKTVEFLSGIGDPARLEIMYLLTKQGRQNVGHIAGNFELSRPAISHHLKVLKNAGIVKSNKVGQEVFYTLDHQSTAAQLRHLAEIIEGKAQPGEKQS